MREWLRQVISNFFIQKYPSRNLWFKRLLYGLIIYKGLQWNFSFHVLFTENLVLFPEFNSIGPIKDLAFVLLKFSHSALDRIFILACVFIGLSQFFYTPKHRLLSFLFDFILWWLVLNLQNKMYFGLSGGNILLNQLLLFNCFISKKPLAISTKKDELLIFFENFAILAIQVQVMLLYFISALSKMGFSEWLDGSAVHQILQIQHFSSLQLGTTNLLSSFLLVLLSYLVLAYQLFFSVCVWWPKINRYFLLFGIAMHIYIGLFMGLSEFAFVMILPYLYFWPKLKLVNS